MYSKIEFLRQTTNATQEVKFLNTTLRRKGFPLMSRDTAKKKGVDRLLLSRGGRINSGSLRYVCKDKKSAQGLIEILLEIGYPPSNVGFGDSRVNTTTPSTTVTLELLHQPFEKKLTNGNGYIFQDPW